MPEWNLVANRLANWPQVGKTNLRTLALPLIVTGLVFVTAFTAGCSNLPLRSLDDTPLPLPPSQTAIAEKVDDQRKQEKTDAESSKTDTAEYSINDFLTPTTPTQPQPDARIIGVYEKADMPAVKLTAIPSLPPAPNIALAAHQDDEQSTEKGTEKAVHQHDENCDCLKPKSLPQLKKMQPLDPEAFIASTRADLDSPTQKIGSSPSLRPLAPPTQADSTAASSIEAPNAIRLTARPKAATLLTASSDPTTAVPETANRAQMLIPIDPNVLKKFKADSMRRAQVEAEAFAKKMAQQSQSPTRRTVSDTIVIDPTITLPNPNAILKTTDAVQSAAMQPSSNATSTTSNSIRVSTQPFESLRSTAIVLPETTGSPARSFNEKSPSGHTDAISNCRGDANCRCSQCQPCKCKAGKCQCRPTVGLILEGTDSLKVQTRQLEKPSPTKRTPAQTTPTKPIQPTLTTIEPSKQSLPLPSPLPSQFEPATSVATAQSENDFQPALPNKPPANQTAPVPNDMFEPSAESSTASAPPAPISEPAGLTELPDMAAIEKSLADFDKANTFDPASIDASHSVDPEMLKAKLKSARPVSSKPQPDRFAQQTDPSDSAAILAKQIASQQSTLQELQSAISQLKPKAKPVAKPVAEPAKPKFKIGNAAFCTRIEGFGQFTPFASNTFANRQQTLLYCEIENQTSNRFADGSGTNQFETLLRGSISIHDANGNVVQSKTFPQIKDVARQRRRDFYVYFPLTLENLASGDYRLELSIEDELGQKKATLTPAIRFSVR
jgi:hypothetical protein